MSEARRTISNIGVNTTFRYVRLLSAVPSVTATIPYVLTDGASYEPYDFRLVGVFPPLLSRYKEL